MKKIFVALVSALLVLLLFCGCRSHADTSRENEKGANPNTVAVQIYK